MSEGPVTGRLDSWKQIAAYMGRTVRTVIRWEQDGGLPVHRVPVGQRQAVFAYPEEIDEWLRKGKDQPAGETAGGLPGSNEGGPALQAGGEPSVSSPRPAIFSTFSRTLSKSLVWLGIAASLLALASVAFAGFSTPTKYRVLGEEQITNDASLKDGLVTDGTNLYFGEWREGWITLSTVSVNGGPIRQILTPFVQTVPVAISPNGQQLLVLAGEGEEKERSLWIVPVRGGPPRRVGDFLCHSAAWSPDGQRIAYAVGRSIYLITVAGRTQRLLHTFAAIPEDLRWSFDGSRLLFRLSDPIIWNSVVWEISLSNSDPFAVASIDPLSRVPRAYDSLSPVLDNEDDAFLGVEGIGSRILLLQKSRLPWNSSYKLQEVTKELSGTGDFAVDATAHKLYLLKESPGQDELDLFDNKSHEFRPFLPGISAVYVDFSRDGRRIAYVHTLDNSLWVAAADGSSARQIKMPKMRDIELPRWSPNGKEIAFMGRRADEPFRIFVTRAAGGPLHEASHGTDNQGAPTWSPDGRHLIYGRVQCQEDRTCAIEEINLNSGQQTIVPSSEGLSTARWSPDGRYIAALNADTHQVFLLDRHTGIWRKLADGVNGNDLAWAPDSRTVYASRPGGDRPEVIRISLNDGRVEPAVDLSDFSKLPGRIDTWFAITPGGSILFLHIAGGQEVYALNYAEK